MQAAPDALTGSMTALRGRVNVRAVGDGTGRDAGRERRYTASSKARGARVSTQWKWNTGAPGRGRCESIRT
jgi:hypothetical protein